MLSEAVSEVEKKIQKLSRKNMPPGCMLSHPKITTILLLMLIPITIITICRVLGDLLYYVATFFCIWGTQDHIVVLQPERQLALDLHFH